MCGRNAISVRGPNHWNSISSESCLIENFKRFANKMKAKSQMILDNHPT